MLQPDDGRRQISVSCCLHANLFVFCCVEACITVTCLWNTPIRGRARARVEWATQLDLCAIQQRPRVSHGPHAPRIRQEPPLRIRRASSVSHPRPWYRSRLHTALADRKCRYRSYIFRAGRLALGERRACTTSDGRALIRTADHGRARCCCCTTTATQ